MHFNSSIIAKHSSYRCQHKDDCDDIPVDIGPHEVPEGPGYAAGECDGGKGGGAHVGRVGKEVCDHSLVGIFLCSGGATRVNWRVTSGLMRDRCRKYTHMRDMQYTQSIV